jgi:deazaflavin-dependent oxidoreductase (nitroreductase family)
MGPVTEYRPVDERRLRDRALHAFVSTKLGRRLFTGVLADIDRFLITRTGGRLQLAIGSPMCLLRARGARSGELRVTPLLFTPRQDQIIIVASKGGAPSHPAWYHNVKANPDVEVDIRGKRHALRGREVYGAERLETWTYINDHFAGYDAYQSMVTRTIPVIVLEPRR